MEFRSKRNHSAKALAMQRLGINGILLAIAYASIETVWPMFLSEFFSTSSQVGFFTAFIAVCSFISLLGGYQLFRKYPAKTLLFFAVTVNAIAVSLFAVTKNVTILIILAIINSAFVAIRIQAFSLLVRQNSSLKTINKNENLIYLFGNIGWVLGPLVAGFFADELSVRAVLMFAALFLLFSVYSITFSTKELRKEQITAMKHISPIKNLKDYFKKKKSFVGYLLSAGLEVWWVIPFIFLPLEIIRQGLSFSIIGVFLFLLGIPLIIVEYFMKNKINSNLRRLIGYGYLFAFVLGIIAAFTNNIYVSMGCFVIASFGLGFVEPSVESFFFSTVNREEAQRYYGAFFTSKTVGGFFGKLLIAIILLYLPLKFGILFVSLTVLGLGVLALKIKKNNKYNHKKITSS